MEDGTKLSMCLTHLEAKWHKEFQKYSDGHVEYYDFTDNRGKLLGRIRVDYHGPRIVNAHPDTKQINSPEGKAREVSEEEKRLNRERHRELAEAHAHDKVEEAQRDLAAVKRTVNVAWIAMGNGLLMTLGTSALTLVVFSWALLVPILLGLVFVVAGGVGVIDNHAERKMYSKEKDVREAERALRDVLTRPLHHYRNDSGD